MEEASNCLEKKNKFIYLAIHVTLKTTWADSCCRQQIFVVFFSPTDGEVSDGSLALRAGCKGLWH